MTDRELLQQALDALNKFDSGKRNHGMLWQVPVIEAIKARLAQPEPLLKKSKGALSHEENKKHNQMIIDRFNALQEQEPVAWWHDRGDVVDLNVSGNGIPLYTAPPKKEWVGLTGEELQEIYQGGGTVHFKLAMAEEKLKEKNT